MPTLLLNADYMPMELSPLSVISWKDGMRAYFSDSMYILKTYDDWVVHSPSTEFKVPSIVVSNRFQKRKEYAPLNRKNLYIRDEYRCQYCGVRFTYRELTYDHVTPRALGGISSWDNLVAACKHCNNKKGHALRMKPMRKPYQPTWHQIYNQSKCYKLIIPDPAWQEYLDWPSDLLEIKVPVNGGNKYMYDDI